MAGSTVESRRVEAITNRVRGEGVPTGLYATHQVCARALGWMDWVANGEEAGTTGEDRPLEGIRVSLSGNVPPGFHIWYQAHVQDLGWMDWVSDGPVAGTPGENRRIEAIRVRMEPDPQTTKENLAC
jgi:uncharacterized protein YjdB